jgi:hypothetical protein
MVLTPKFGWDPRVDSRMRGLQLPKSQCEHAELRLAGKTSSRQKFRAIALVKRRKMGEIPRGGEPTNCQVSLIYMPGSKTEGKK